VVKAMKDGEPSIGIRSEAGALMLGVWMMKPGEEKVVAKRLREVLAARGSKQA
jgi:L-seryl-tRNA(Ser) seleniumtransferase